MATAQISADASPEKRLFISLLTRDISLVAAFLDLIDNSVNAAIEPFASKLRTAQHYEAALRNPAQVPGVDIILDVGETTVGIRDNAAGISAQTAKEHVFKFGRSGDESHASDRLSVYGIGLKRAIFKLGNRVDIESEHVEGGFSMNLNVQNWSKLADQPWTFKITPRPPARVQETGTTIVVNELYDETKRRLKDGVFLGQLKEAVARTYAFYLSKFVNIYINDEKIEAVPIQVGSNYASANFTSSHVTCAITAGIGIPGPGGTFRDRSSGWFVFCNGRTVIAADKTPLTGWGQAPIGLPLYQPKHRAFTGTVFFVSEDAEKLPWNTTKSGINEDSAAWQEAKQHMAQVGRQVVSFLDSRYSDEGTEVSSEELRKAAGAGVSVIAAAVAPRRAFAAPVRPVQKTTKVQYDAKVSDVKRIAEYVGRTHMSGSEVGRYTFEYFLKNEVGEK